MLDPIFVVTYKNRDGNIIQKLLKNTLSVDANRKVHFLCYDFDFVESGYDKYELPDNMSFIKIDFQKDFIEKGYERCIQAKRHYLINKAQELEYNKCWMLDDDLLSVWKVVPRIGKCNDKIEVPLEEALQYLEKEVENKQFSVACYPYNKGSLEFTWYDKPSIALDAFPIDGVYLNIDEFKRTGLNYTPLRNHAEDLMITADSYRKGLHTIKLNGSYCLHFDPPGKSGSITNNYKILSYNVWKEYGRLFRYVDKNNKAGKNKVHYINVQLDRKRLEANVTKINDEAQIEMEKATNADEWTEIVSNLTKKYNLKKKGL